MASDSIEPALSAGNTSEAATASGVSPPFTAARKMTTRKRSPEDKPATSTTGTTLPCHSNTPSRAGALPRGVSGTGVIRGQERTSRTSAGSMRHRRPPATSTQPLEVAALTESMASARIDGDEDRLGRDRLDRCYDGIVARSD